MPHPLRLEITYSNRKPVALADLTNGLNSFADEYRRTVKQHSSRFEDDKVRLYITDIRSGSIIAHMMPLVPVASGLLENPIHVVEFSRHLRDSFSYLLGRHAARQSLDQRSLKNIGAIVEPVIKEGGAWLTFNGPFKNDERDEIRINSHQAVEIKKNVRAEIERLKAPNTKTLDDVRLHWYQARNDRTQAGDRAVIPDIYEKPVKVMFFDDAIKRRMLHEFGNPFERTYTVDVIADFTGRKPKTYHIVKLHTAA